MSPLIACSAHSFWGRYYPQCGLFFGLSPHDEAYTFRVCGSRYLDLPFGSNRTYTSTRKEFGRFPSFDDRRTGGLSYNVSWITERSVECKRLLKKTGSISALRPIERAAK